ncbi:MAG: hypothetical protein IKY51_00290 [Alistipes sp.]|nr:hypothetical protein [Alistipes sp.]
MNTKVKIALLTLLGFSASACCGTKKAAKGEDKKEQDIIITEDNDPRIKLMYGVPFPDGTVVRPIDEESKEVVREDSKEAIHDEVDDVDMVLE